MLNIKIIIYSKLFSLYVGLIPFVIRIHWKHKQNQNWNPYPVKRNYSIVNIVGNKIILIHYITYIMNADFGLYTMDGSMSYLGCVIHTNAQIAPLITRLVTYIRYVFQNIGTYSFIHFIIRFKMLHTLIRKTIIIWGCGQKPIGS